MPKLPDNTRSQLLIRHPILTPQTINGIARKRHIRVLERMASGVLQPRALAPEVRMRTEEHRQFRRVIRPHPWLGRHVGEIAVVQVSECESVGLLAEADGFGCWAEEDYEEVFLCDGFVGAVGVVWCECDAVLRVCAYDRGL